MCRELARDILTEAEKAEDSVHGVLDVGRVVFQAEDEELVSIKDSEPVQKIHGVQPDLQPHLGPSEEEASFQVEPQHTGHYAAVLGCVLLN